MRPTVIVLVVAALLVASADAWGRRRWVRTATTVCLWHGGGWGQTETETEGQRETDRQT